MLADYLKVLWVIDTAKKIKTRKRIQKIIYLLQEKGAPFAESFSLHHYGPYSSELQIELDQLEEADFIKQDSAGESYIFELTQKGRDFLEIKRGSIKDLDSSVFKGLIAPLNETEPYILEMMATMVYFEKSYGRDKGQLKSVLATVKPHLEEFFDNASRKLDDLSLHAPKGEFN